MGLSGCNKILDTRNLLSGVKLLLSKIYIKNRITFQRLFVSMQYDFGEKLFLSKICQKIKMKLQITLQILFVAMQYVFRHSMYLKWRKTAALRNISKNIKTGTHRVNLWRVPGVRDKDRRHPGAERVHVRGQQQVFGQLIGGEREKNSKMQDYFSNCVLALSRATSNVHTASCFVNFLSICRFKLCMQSIFLEKIYIC